MILNQGLRRLCAKLNLGFMDENIPDREYVEAPAGHGKTESIVQKIASQTGKQKILVLTHTNAGVNSLKRRLKKNSIDSAMYDLQTIDAFCLKYSRYYPSISGMPKKIEDFAYIDYKQAQKGAIEIFKHKEFKTYLAKRYSLLVVDEYQDCSLNQHNLVLQLSEILKCLVFGDPMQGIFDFDSDGFSWEEHLSPNFNKSSEISLDIPYRWVNSGNEELGLWISEVRETLKKGNISEINFSTAPINVTTYPYETTQQTFVNGTATAISKIIPEKGTVLALIPNVQELKDLHHEIAGKMFRPLQSIDRMDSKKLIKFLRNLDTFLRTLIRKPVSLYGLIRDDLAKSCMTGTKALPPAVKNKLNLYKKGCDIGNLRLQGARLRGNNLILYNLILDIYNVESYEIRVKSIINLMNFVESESRTKFRNDLWLSAKDALKKNLNDVNKSLEECGYVIRQKKSFLGRNLFRVIGNTLLTKGLEFDHVIIVDPFSFTNKNLYVSISRAKKTIHLLFPSISVIDYSEARRENWSG